MPATVWFASGSAIKDSIKYKYDSCGNICRVTQNGHIVAKYGYDSLNRLIREDKKLLNKTKIFTYDNNGNIVECCEYAYTSKTGEELSELDCTHYSYDYDGDRLDSYDGESFDYDTAGNPKTYRGKTAVWQYGRYLTSYNGTAFTYDGLGRRATKGSITFTYDSDGRLINQSNGLEFIYDNANVIGVKYSNEQYFYRRDAQGNIIAILNSNGAVVANYVYDAWGNVEVKDNNGNVITSGIGVLNPFRYRGYYYDTETKLYFLQTRYYDPEVGRFISQDSIDYADPETINGINLYSYCGDNPVMNVDPTGDFGLSVILISMLIGAVFGAVTSGIKAANDGLDIKGIVLSAIGGAIMGAAVAGAFALGGAAATGLTILHQAVNVSGVALFAIASYGTAVAGVLNYQFSSMAYGNETSAEGYFLSAFDGFMEGATSFGLGWLAGASGYFKSVEKSIFKKSKIIETITRSVKYSLPSTIIRSAFKGLFQYSWRIKW